MKARGKTMRRPRDCADSGPFLTRPRQAQPQLKAKAETGGFNADPGQWLTVFDHLIGEMLVHRKLFLMHDRNRAAFEELHLKEQVHENAHDDMEEQFRRVLNDPDVPLHDKVRLTCAQGVILAGVILSGDELSEVSSADLATELRSAVRDLLVDPAP
jgi:hypothetical protein